MRTRTTVVLGVIVAMFVPGWVASSAIATPPVTLSSEYVTDDAGVLSSSELSAANARLAELAADNGGDLYVVFVDEFTDPADSVAWVDDTAVDNGLGADQYLIAVAVDSSQSVISVDENAQLSDDQIDHVLQAMEDDLHANDWDGAVIAAADAFPGQSGAAGGSIGGILWILVPIAAVIISIVFIVRAVKRKKRRAQPPIPDPNAPYASVSDDDLEKQAGTALVEADDAITSSRQEVGFAVAQYGEDSTTTFTKAVDAAKAKVSEAFALKQKIDDEIPDTDEQRRAWHIQIIQLCDEADDVLDDNVQAFEELRKLEAEAPEALEQLKVRRATAQTALATAPAALEALTQSYDAAALAPVAENPAQAQQRLSLSDTEIADATRLIAEGKSGEAAFAIRTAEEAVAQSEQLITAVTTLGANLAAVEEQARALIADLEADLAAAAALPEAQGQLAPIIARTRTNIDTAQAELQGNARRNPQQVLDTLGAANTQIDEAVGHARDAAAEAQRIQRTLQQRLAQAQAQISAANDFILTRRGAIGATARTRLAEANAAYTEALSLEATDPPRATERATRAYSLANQALSSANTEVSSFNSGGWSGGGWGGGYNSGYDRGSDLGGDILGGILGGLFSGGGGGGGGGWSSGSSRRSSSSRSSRASSFGSSRGSRSSSRSSSRGGGRSRGGRF